MLESVKNLVGLIRGPDGRWLIIGQALEAAVNAEQWKAHASSQTAWFEQIAVSAGRSATYLARCLSMAKYVKKIQALKPELSDSKLSKMPLSSMEELRKQAGEDNNKIDTVIYKIFEQKLGYDSLRQIRDEGIDPQIKGEKFENMIENHLSNILQEIGYNKEISIIKNGNLSIRKADFIVVNNNTHELDVFEIKNNLSARSLEILTEQALAYASLSRCVWLILSSDSSLPADKLIRKLRSIRINNVGVILFDPIIKKISEVIRPEFYAPLDETRKAVQQILLPGFKDA